jgi:hypothetical protein
MKTRTENNGLTDVTVIKADEGKVLVRKGYEDDLLGEELWLGYSYYIGGVKQDPPHFDVPSDFTEVDAPEGYYGEDISDEEALQIITGQ